MNTAGQLASGGTSISDGIFDYYLCPGPFRTLSVSLWGHLYFCILVLIDCLYVDQLFVYMYIYIVYYEILKVQRSGYLIKGV